MIETLQTIWAFMKEGVIISVIVALVLPWVGAILLVRRTSFLGVAVPQFSAAGIALGLAALPWFPALQQEYLDHGHPPLEYLFLFAAGAAALALFAFGAMSSRRGGHLAEGQVAAGFALATAIAMIALEFAPSGANLVETLQRGSVVVADVHSLGVVAVVDGLALIALFLLTPAILLISFDREMAVVLGHRPMRYELAWNTIVGASVGVGVMTIGPVLVFGLLFLPPLVARQLASSMRQFLALAVLLALLPILLAWPASFELDLPYGPTATLALAVLVIPWGIMRILRARRAQG
ncbi:MAG: hypothetical protein CMJ94_01295 [Planctomycetes bacterium]|nr:hypothetical protein [Planctomycetota bacterium]